MSHLTPIKDAAARNKVAGAALIQSYKDIAAAYAEHKDEPAEIQALSDELTSQAVALEAAIFINTPTPLPPVE